MDEDTKYIIKSLTENLAAITEKQAIILELLASKLPDISDAEKGKLRESAKMNEENAKKLASILEKPWMRFFWYLLRDVGAGGAFLFLLRVYPVRTMRL
jgi:hypothetical protein